MRVLDLRSLVFGLRLVVTPVLPLLLSFTSILPVLPFNNFTNDFGKLPDNFMQLILTGKIVGIRW